MALGLGLLRLPPAHFWSMTPKELDAALTALIGPVRRDTPPARATLRALMNRYPDGSSSGLSRGSIPPRAASP